MVPDRSIDAKRESNDSRATGVPAWVRRLEPIVWGASVILPVALLTVLGVCAGRQYWQQWHRRPESFAQGLGNEPTRLGHRPETPADMRYEADGCAHLGDYSVKLYDPANGTTLRADFTLSGETDCADRASFDGWIARHGRFLREQVMVTVRNSNLKELSGSKQEALERKLVARVNRSLGKPFLKSVRFKSYVLYESVRNSDYVLWEGADGREAIRQ